MDHFVQLEMSLSTSRLNRHLFHETDETLGAHNLQELLVPNLPPKVAPGAIYKQARQGVRVGT